MERRMKRGMGVGADIICLCAAGRRYVGGCGETGNKKGELPRLECFHNGIILIVICF